MPYPRPHVTSEQEFDAGPRAYYVHTTGEAFLTNVTCHDTKKGRYAQHGELLSHAHP